MEIKDERMDHDIDLIMAVMKPMIGRDNRAIKAVRNMFENVYDLAYRYGYEEGRLSIYSDERR